VGTAEDLISALRATCSGLPDKRRGKNVQYLMADIGMTAFSVFFMQPIVPGPSAAFGGRVRAWSLELPDAVWDGADSDDNHVRDMLDPVEPECFHPLFPCALEMLQAGGGLTAFRRLGDHVLIAFDGTEYHRSIKLHRPYPSEKKMRQRRPSMGRKTVQNPQVSHALTDEKAHR
jgi:hypothetical protein